MTLERVAFERDSTTREVIYENFRIYFTRTEWRVLERLYMASPGLVTHGAIEAALENGRRKAINENYPRVIVYEIRKKLKPLPIEIHNFFGDGWRMVRKRA